MRALSLTLLLLTVTVFSSGCMAGRMGPGLRQHGFGYEGYFGGYFSYTDLRGYDAEIVRVDILNNEQQPGELLNLDLWPIGGIGLGPIGIRGHLGPIGGGLGGLYYIPDSVGKGTVNTDKDFYFKLD